MEHLPQAADDDPGWRKTRTTLIQRLGEALVDGAPVDMAQWQRDIGDFVADYRSAVIAVCRPRHHDRAGEVADRFLGEVIANPQSLKNWRPATGAFRAYLQGWLRNYGSKERREDLTHEHRNRRSGEAGDDHVARSSVDDLERAEERAWVREVVRLAVARLHLAALRTGAPAQRSDAWLIARDYGIPLPGEHESDPQRLPRDQLAARLGITRASLRNRKVKAIGRLVRYLERAIRDTAGTDLDMDVERTWFFGVFDEEHPELARACREVA